MLDLKYNLSGSEARSGVGEKSEYPTIWNHLNAASSGKGLSTYGPTPTHIKSLENAKTIYNQVKTELDSIENKLNSIEEKLNDLDAPKIDD